MEIPALHVRADNKIFISIASYRDPLLKFTVTQAYDNAKNKDQLIFGIVEQNDLEDSLDIDSLPFKNQIRYVRIDAEQSRGCCWARNLVQSLYSDERYYLQIDSHTAFDDAWDEKFTFSLEELLRYHKKPIITQYPDALKFDDNGDPVKKHPTHEINKIPFVGPSRNDDEVWVAPNSLHIIACGFMENSFQPYSHGFMLSAGCIFTLGKFVEEVPYDPRLFFQGEETTLALRAWTKGWNIFHMKEVPLFHLYTEIETKTRTLFWDEDQNEKRDFDWGYLEDVSVIKTNSILSGSSIDAFGIGKDRTLEQFAIFSGIDYKNKIYTNKQSLPRHDFKKSPEDFIRRQ